MELVLVRHAESIWNAEQRWQGQTDVPLSARGEDEARALGARIRALPFAFDRRISSDLARTASTADAIASGGWERDRRWREIDLGAWGGLLHSEVQERFPHELEAMASGADVRLGGGESIPGFDARCLAALDATIAASRPGDRVLVVTHGGVIRSIVMHLLGIRGRRALIGSGNTAITHLRHDPERGLSLVAYNCDAHLARAADEGDLVVGAHGQVIEHLGLDARVASRFHPARAGSITRIAPHPRGAMLRCYATPALEDER